MAAITQTLTMGGQGSSDWLATFDPFNPTLGTLNSALLTMTGTSVLDLSAENLDRSAVGLDVATLAYFNFSHITGSLLLTANAAGNAALGAYDGTTDFSGTSGVASLAISGSASGSVALLDGLTNTFGVQAWIATRTSLDVSAGAGLRMLTGTTNTVQATLTYDYTPSVAGGGGTVGSVITTTPPPAFTDVSDPPPFTAPTVPPPPTVTSQAQSFSFATAAAGWSGTSSVTRFDPAQGTLRSVNLTLSTNLDAMARLENHTNFGGYVLVNQSVGTSVAVPGLAATIAYTSAGTARDLVFLSPWDGSDDFTGQAGTTLTGAPIFHTERSMVSDSAGLAAFTGGGTIDLGVQTTGSSSIGGALADLLTQLDAAAGATLTVSYTYEPTTPVTPIAVANATNGGTSTPTPEAYTGPVAGILNEFAQITPDNIAVSAATDSWYIRTGDGDDAIQVFGGTNVLDGGRGSNFLTGGAGQDTFCVDAQWVDNPMWNTIVGMDSGDAVTIWGLLGNEITTWRDNQGAPGATGLTLHARMPFSPTVSTTLAGYSQADLDSGRLVTSYGTADDVPYLHIRAV